MQELVELRTENTKTFDADNGKRQLEIHIGAVHYKDNYNDESEPWKDIDLRWEGNKITKAPYELTLDSQKVTLKDKKTGQVTVIETLSSQPATQSEIVPDNQSVKVRHTLSSDKLPFTARFKVTGDASHIQPLAFDEEGELELDTSFVNGILTERLTEVRGKNAPHTRPPKGKIIVDPTWQTGATDDDCQVRWATDNATFAWRYSHALTIARAGKGSTYAPGSYRDGCGLRFANVTIPQYSQIDSAYLTLQALYNYDEAGETVNTVIIGELASNPVGFSTLADYQGRRGSSQGSTDFPTGTPTVAYVNWDSIAAWVANTDYDSPSISTIIQEIVNQAGWASGNALVIFWDDHAYRSTNTTGPTYPAWRGAKSYDESAANAPKLIITFTILFTPKIFYF